MGCWHCKRHLNSLCHNANPYSLFKFTFILFSEVQLALQTFHFLLFFSNLFTAIFILAGKKSYNPILLSPEPVFKKQRKESVQNGIQHYLTECHIVDSYRSIEMNVKMGKRVLIWFRLIFENMSISVIAMFINKCKNYHDSEGTKTVLMLECQYYVS